MDNYSQEYPQQQQQSPSQQRQQQQQWHLLGHQPSSFPSPVSPPSALSEQHYPNYHYTGDHLDRSSSNLSLNLSSLTVASPTNLSPINPSPLHSHSNSTASSTLSPVTPISPSQSSFHHIQTHYQYADPTHYAPEQQQYDRRALVPVSGTTASSRSSSSSEVEKSVPRKRSFTTNTGTSAPLPPPPEEPLYDDPHQQQQMDLGISTPASYDDMDVVGYTGQGGTSPVDGSTSGGEGDDMLKPLDAAMTGTSTIPPSSMSVLGKPMGTNNFVTKLYQMINDPKSTHFIAWTELGTSFVVSNVGEFSRSILGSHFKHNNFSSFVRQLNMYGFHKINRTPRAQRTSTDAQTWEFSHHKFLRGRPDLLDEIKRKALEPDPAIKHRVELPGEVAAQLGQMRDENRRMWDALVSERRKVDRLVNVMKGLWDVVGKGFPGSVPPFPSDLLESTESPNIFVTSPTASSSRYPPPLTMPTSNQSLHSLHSVSSPNSSPTTADFPTLSRQHSFQHVSFHPSAASTPLPPSPSMDIYDIGDDPQNQGRKRQRTSNDSTSGDPSVNGSTTGVQGPKRMSRARSDSAPLGYHPSWQHSNRPRSGSGLAGNRGAPAAPAQVRGTPLLSIATVGPGGSPGR